MAGKRLITRSAVALLGDLTFTPSVDHATVSSYAARLYADGTSTPVLASVNIGKPTPNGSNVIRVDLLSFLNSQTPGNYLVKVVALSSGGSTESVNGDSFTVPVVTGG